MTSFPPPITIWQFTPRVIEKEHALPIHWDHMGIRTTLKGPQEDAFGPIYIVSSAGGFSSSLSCDLTW